MLDVFFERELINSVEKARKSAELKLKYNSYNSPENILQKSIEDEFSILNFHHQNRNHNSIFTFSKEIQLDKIYETPEREKRHFEKSAIGGGLIIAGLPLIKKRFVMPGSAVGTSIASKYLSKALPQVMTTRILGTRVLGRAIGRAVPYVGWILLAIDVVELIIEENQDKSNKNRFGGFGGGFYGGGGANGRW